MKKDKPKSVSMPKTYDGMGGTTKSYPKGWPFYGCSHGETNPHGKVTQRGKGAATRGYKSSGKMG